MIRFLIFFLLVSCGKSTGKQVAPPVVSPDNIVVLGRASFTITTTNPNQISKLMNVIIPSAYAANPSSQPVTVVLAGTTTMTMSNASFSTPTLSNGTVDFGNLIITALQTNDLKKCGANGNTKCTKALFRIYTSGKPGAGFWNDADAYGVPLIATGPTGAAEAGLNQANAHMVQVFTIPNNQNVIRLADFTPAPSFNISGDFYNAGAGTYSTTINVEFALAP